jgi:hypothetical protein
LSTDVSEVSTASIIRLITLMMAAVRTSETSVNFYLTTWQYSPEDSKLIDVSEVSTASIIRLIALMMEAVRTSETSVDNHFTRQYNPEDSSEHHAIRIYFALNLFYPTIIGKYIFQLLRNSLTTFTDLFSSTVPGFSWIG